MPLEPQDFIAPLLGRIIHGLRPDDAVTKHYTRLIGQFGQQALTRWVAVSQTGLKCQLLTVDPHGVRHGCPRPAAGPCVVCGHTVCLEHAHASPIDGNLICRGCVVSAARATRGGSHAPGQRPPPPASGDFTTDVEERRQRLDVLNLPLEATEAEIKQRFKELSRSYHPDTLRGMSKEERDMRSERYKKITEAYHWLLSQEAA